MSTHNESAAGGETSPAVTNAPSTAAAGPDETDVGFATLTDGSGALDLDSDDALVVVHAEHSQAASERYVVGPEIARGGMGSILAVRDRAIRRRVAMKVLRPKHRNSSEQISRLVHEAQVTGQLEHPNIVPVHELGRDDDGLPYYTMKWIAGTTLKLILDRLRLGDPLYIRQYPLSRLLNIFLRAADAVAFAHSRGVIHRDLKPDNIMAGDFGEVLVLDWGLAKILDPEPETPAEHQRKIAEFQSAVAAASATVTATIDDHEHWSSPLESVLSDRAEDPETHHTLQGQTLGTPAYMSPEQALGDLAVMSERSDIYALGAILYHILALRPPVIGENVNEVLARVKEGRVTDLAELPRAPAGGPPSPRLDQPVELLHMPDKRIPSSLAAIVMKALSHNPDDRYASVTDLQRDVEAYREGFATHAEDASLYRHTVLLLRRHKTATAIACVATLLLAATVYSAFAGVQNQRNLAQSDAELARQSLLEFREESQKRRAISLDAAPLFIERADRHFATGDFAAAATAVEKALSLDANLTDGYFRRGILYLRRQRYGEASDAFRRAGEQPGFALSMECRLLRAISDRLGAASLPGSTDRADATAALDRALREVDEGRWHAVVLGP